MQAVTNARGYDWATWRLGIMRSFLSGASMAFMTFGGSALLEIPARKSLYLVGFNFFAMGFYRLGEFLQLHGAPDKLQESLAAAAASTAQAGAAISEAQKDAGTKA